MIGKLDEEFRFQETALRLRAQRQQLLASNIANADTPHYKARDVDFAKALQNALGGGDAKAPAASAGATSTSAAGTGNAGNANDAQSIPADMFKQVAMLKTDANHMSVTNAADVPGTIGGLVPQYRSTIQGSVDDNSVDMDMERNQFTDNALRYEASVTIMTAEMKQMLTAIQGQ
jgi:flagellar basal-body rod protein FlgB